MAVSDFKIKNGLTANGAVTFTAAAPSTSTTTGTLIVTGGVGISGALNAATKSFSIPHPTKPGMTLRHGSLEGPEFGVYVRGKTTTGTIDLPDYWAGLIDDTTITVNLTAIGGVQHLYVVSTTDKQVIIRNGLNPVVINCFYTIFAERKDVARMVIESTE